MLISLLNHVHEPFLWALVARAVWTLSSDTSRTVITSACRNNTDGQFVLILSPSEQREGSLAWYVWHACRKEAKGNSFCCGPYYRRRGRRITAGRCAVSARLHCRAPSASAAFSFLSPFHMLWMQRGWGIIGMFANPCSRIFSNPQAVYLHVVYVYLCVCVCTAHLIFPSWPHFVSFLPEHTTTLSAASWEILDLTPLVQSGLS